MGYENNYIWYGILSGDQLNTEDDRGQILIVCPDLRGMSDIQINPLTGWSSVGLIVTQ